ncbi:MAG TPA: UDP-N-acetylmuramate--L-alanine ligase [Streptosporangiaceae bacterium]|nr:UDP-N-acetylmuramate--L-alanine ligase [Streptosporangiaceae bacterium]
MGRLVTPAAPVPLAQLGRVHFIGIGGAGMSGIARIMINRGVAVSGSDAADSGMLHSLASLGADVHVGHDAASLDGADTVVVSTAIRPDNPELAQARRLGLRVLHRSTALASLMLGRRGAAVAGTHGKTTTSAMLATVLRRGGADPGYVVGGVLTETGLGADDGAGELFVVEADESDGSFLALSPELAVLTCVEADHLDNYEDLAEIEATFARFVGCITSGGVLVACGDDPGARAAAATARGLGLRVVTYGEAGDTEFRVSEVVTHGMSVEFRLSEQPGTDGGAAPQAVLTVGVPGHHNALNAAAAYAAARLLGLDAASAAEGLAGYRGAGRRLEPKGEGGGVLVLDSYAHHPTELAADLRAAREIRPAGRVIAVFQPHLFSRTRIFAAQFGAALGLADEALVLDVYAAREDPEPGVSGLMVSQAVPGGRGSFEPDRAAVPSAVADLAKPGDLVLTMGAGDVTALGPQIVAALRERAGQLDGPPGESDD